MGKKILIGFVLLLIVGFTLCCSGTQITVDNARIEIDSGGHHIEGSLARPSTYQMLLKDEGVSIGTFSGSAFVTMLPLDTADRLRAKYGDFFKCNTPGVSQARDGLKGTVLVANEEKVKQEIAEAMSLVRKSRIPVVSFNGSRILITKHTFRKIRVSDQTGTVLYFLNDFRILKTDYLS
jgi:hypothetical protein